MSKKPKINMASQPTFQVITLSIYQKMQKL